MRKYAIGLSSHKAGLSPGTLIFSGERRVDQAEIHCMHYDGQSIEEKDITTADLISFEPQEGKVTWINITGVHDAATVKAIGDKFGLHPLVQEDVMNTRQRPKLETYDDYIYVVMKMLDFLPESREVMEEQLSLVLKAGLVITFQEEECEIFDQVKIRLRMAKGKIRSREADYLAYALLDAIVDEYFFILEAMGEELDALEEGLIQVGGASHLERMQALKRQIIGIRKHIWPTREVVNGLVRSDSDLVRPETVIFLRDVHDHTMQIAESIEAYREIAGSVQDLYLSVVNNKMNEVMKVLAGISTIFLPMTLVAGIYGMNFDFMPELDEPWAYPAALGLMGLIGGGIFLYFRLKKWL